MIVPLFLVLFTASNALEAKNENSEEIKKVLLEHMNKIHDIEDKYVMNNRMARMLGKYLGGKINVLPMFKISMKIDRHPVRIPWNVGGVNTATGVNKSQAQPVYRVHKHRAIKMRATPDEKEIDDKHDTKGLPKNDTQVLPKKDTQDLPKDDTKKMPKNDTQDLPKNDTQVLPKKDKQDLPKDDTKKLPKNDTKDLPKNDTTTPKTK
ncbi:hypothetical protein NE865_16520 [Phthorimaea operculella]|nr:hypothetical protein NE865_16520 [Phthorimaea operculella]